MSENVKTFLKRGLAFAGFGPIIWAIIYFILSKSIDGFSLNGTEAFVGVLSTYLLAFVCAGASLFNQIESWSKARSLVCHFSTLYPAYLICYLVNSWIPFDLVFLAVFTAVFAATYFAIWFSVYLAVRSTSRKINECLENYRA